MSFRHPPFATGLALAACAVLAIRLGLPAASADSLTETAQGADHALHLPVAINVSGVGHSLGPVPTRTPTGVAPTQLPETPTTPATPSPTPSPTSPVPGDCSQIANPVPSVEPLEQLHVRTSGSDETGDGSAANPFANIGRAARAAGPGTAIVVHEGVYAGGVYLDSLVGTQGAPITLGGAAGEPMPVIAGGSEGLHLTRASWLLVHDLKVTAAENNGINADDGGAFADPLAAHHVAFVRLDISDVGGNGNQDCLKLSGINDFLVADSTFARCGGGNSGSGIDMVGAHRGLIAHNAFRSMSANAVQAKGGTTDVDIFGNYLADAGARGFNLGGSTGFEFFRPPLDPNAENAEARRIRATANVIEGGETPFAFVGCVDCSAIHNTIVDPDRWLLRILQETTTRDGFDFAPSRDNLVANNLYTFLRGSLSGEDVNIGPNTRADTFHFRNNLWYAHDVPSQSAPSLPAPEQGAVIGQDPGLAADLRPDPSSPAFQAGATGLGVAADGVGVCYRSPPSIGAREVP